MANTIRIKRRPSSGSAGAPSAASLYNGELAFNENDNTLYYAYGSGVGGISTAVPAIAGSGAYALRGGTNATGTWPISVNGNSASVTNGVYTTGDQTIEGTKTFYGSGTNGSAVAIKSETNYPASLSFMEGSSLPKISFIWDGSVGVNKFKLNTGSTPATAYTFQVNTHLEVRATGTNSSATNIPVFISNPNSSAQTIYTRTPSELKSDIGLSNVTNDIQVKQTTGGTTVGYLPTWNSTSGELLAAGYAVSTNLVTNSGSTHIPRADSVVNYVSSGLANHVHGNITNDGKIGSTANLPLITTTNGTITTGSFGSTANTFCQGNDSRLSDTRNTTNSITVNNGGAGDSSSFTFNGSAAKTISYNSVGAPSQTGALASGSNWNISILGNSATVTNGVYTSRTLNAGSGLVGGGDLSSDRTFNIGQGDGMSISADSIAVDNTVVRTTGGQTIGGIKTFNSQVNISGNLGQYLLFRSTNAGNYANIVFDGNNYDAAAQSSYIISNTGNMEIAHGQKIQLNSAIEVKAANTSGNSVGYFAVFDSNPASSLTTLKSVSKDQILDDIGAATSGLDITAGSGLVGGGTLSQNRRFDIGQGDGISVSADSIAVNSTVVRTTGNQGIEGLKEFYDNAKFGDGNQTIVAIGEGLGPGNSGVGVFDYNSPIAAQYWEGTQNIIHYGYGGGTLSSPRIAVLESNGNVGIGTSSPGSQLHVVGTGLFSSVLSVGGSPLGNQPVVFIKSPNTSNTSSSFKIEDSSYNTLLDVRNDGNIGIGLSSPSYVHRLNIKGSTSDSSAATLSLVNSSNNTILLARNDGNIGIRTVTPSAQLHVNGSGIFSSGLNIANQTASTIAGFDSDKNVVSLSTSTYPSLTEIAYVKGVTSAIQTQLNNKIAKTSSTTIGNIPTWSVTTGDALGTGYSVETTLAGSSTAIARADAVKTYVDNAIVSGISTNDAMVFKGAIDCSANPNYPAADRGWTYKVSVAGKIGGASGPTVEVNDTLICSTDGTSSGTHAVVGSNWIILQTNITDASILVTGPTSATSGNIALFDGTTGKIIKDAGFAATTVGQNLVSLTNPSAITFLKVNANNTVSTESASTYRTSLGANTVGSNIFTLTNPSAISFLRINADNTVTARSASELKTDLSLNNVENTALSTWAGSTNITTLGTIGTGTWNATTIAVNKGGTGQTSYVNGELLIGNSTGNTLTKATLTQGTAIDITNGAGSITIGHNDTSTLTGAQGSNGIASFTVDGMGHVTAVTTATYLTAGTVCAAIVDCTLDGGTF